MSEYIKRETTKHQLLTLFAHNKELIDEWLVYCVDDLIDDIPAADVVEVVRCGECKCFDRKTSECHNPRFGNGWANYPPPSVNDDFYCADGERKDGADDETV